MAVAEKKTREEEENNGYGNEETEGRRMEDPADEIIDEEETLEQTFRDIERAAENQVSKRENRGMKKKWEQKKRQREERRERGEGDRFGRCMHGRVLTKIPAGQKSACFVGKEFGKGLSDRLLF